MLINCLFAGALAFSAGAAVDAPVTHVTVFSDRAHVMRTATPRVGARQVELPLLPDTVDPSTISVAAAGGAVQRVDIARVDAEEFPRGEAQKLLLDIERLDDQIAKVRGERSHTLQVLDAVRRLAPESPEAGALKAIPKLNPAGWVSVLSFVESWSDNLQGAVRALDEKLVDLFEARAPLADRARLLGGGARRAGYRVTVALLGSGTVRVVLTYVAWRARWFPTYDIQFAPERGEVQLAFAGLVTQESGEDWTDAQLVLSTAIPATARVFPKLYSWKIGERERFVPTPRAVVDTVRPPPRSEAITAGPDIDTTLRQQLLARASETMAAVDEGGLAYPKPVVGKIAKPLGHGAHRIVVRDSDRRSYEERRGIYRPAPSGKAEGARPPRSAPPEPMEFPSPAPTVSMSAPRRVYVSQPRGFRFVESAPPVPTESVGLAPPPGYQRPTYAPNFPASLAGGYDLTFKSRRPETIRSGKGARRVALLTERWPVTIERKLFAALAPEAYLVAELKNPSKTVLPGGTANLFVGADPAGVARLTVVAPGESFTLPLGIDRAVKPIRNVRQNTTEKGLFSKDEITEYVVTIEVANPYRVPIATRIIDQLPMTGDKNVEIKLEGSEPGVRPHPDTGALEWRVEIPASGKSIVSFTYTLRRPKGYRLHQN
ncbi:MAG: mucoidy inhibitor MuiA family protein [Deltaproteobacteria bacterium]|nr:mucoidy inhibitor MuiA family protein [Deltaproteobacteria bacterium]